MLLVVVAETARPIKKGSDKKAIPRPSSRLPKFIRNNETGTVMAAASKVGAALIGARKRACSKKDGR